MNIFTNDDYRRIQAWLKANAIKDSDFAVSESTVPNEDILVITQNMSTVPTNYRISIKNLLNSSLGKVVIDKIIAKAVTVNNVLTVDAANVVINNDKGETLQDIIDWCDDIKASAKEWKIEYQDPQQDEPTVRAKYVLKDYKGVPKGNVIKVYKDSAITNVYLGTTEDTCNSDTGEVTKKPVHDNNEALSIVYRVDTGKYMLVNVPLGIFTREAEFDKYRGLGIEPNGQVFVKLASDVESTNYLHFNSLGEIAADGIEARILRDLGTLILSVAGDGTMWGQYKQEEGTQETSTPNDGSRWGEYKEAEAHRDALSNSNNIVYHEEWDGSEGPEWEDPVATEASYAYNWKTTDTPADDGKTQGNLKDLYNKTLESEEKITELERKVSDNPIEYSTELKQSEWIDIEVIPNETTLSLKLVEDRAGDGVTILGRNSTDADYQVLAEDTIFKIGSEVFVTTDRAINQIRLNTKKASTASVFSKKVIISLADTLERKVDELNAGSLSQKEFNKSVNTCVFTDNINANSYIKELYIETDIFPLKAYFSLGTNTWFVVTTIDGLTEVAQFKVNGNEGKITESVAGSASSGYILFNNFSTITQREDNITILKDALDINKSPYIYAKINIEPNVSDIKTIAQNAKTTADKVDALVGDDYSFSIETDKKQGDWTPLDNELPIGTELSLLCTKDEAGDGITVLASSNDTHDTYFVLVSDTKFKVGVSKNIVISENIKWLKLNTKKASTASVFGKKVNINISTGLVRDVDKLQKDVVQLKNDEKWSTIGSTLDVSFNTLFKSANKCFATLIDDDTAALAAIENIKSICDNKNIKCTFACITDNLSIEGMEQKLLDYQDEGFNIVSHSKTHNASVWKFASYEELPLSAIEKEMSISKRVLLQKGFFDSDYIVYPWGLVNNDTWKNIVAKLSRKYFKAGCSHASKKYNAKVTNDKCLLYRIQISTVTTINQIKAYIDECFNQNGWLIIYTHSNMPEFSADMLNQTIDYIKEKGIEFKTLAEGWQLRKQLYQYKDIVE